MPWDVLRLRSCEKVAGAEPLDAANKVQPIASTVLANEASGGEHTSKVRCLEQGLCG